MLFAAPRDAHEQRARSQAGERVGIGWHNQLVRGVILGPRRRRSHRVRMAGRGAIGWDYSVGQ